AGFLRRVAVLRDDAGGTERGGGAQDGADVARVGDLVEHDERAGALEDGGQRRLRQRIGEQRDALVDHVAAEHLVHARPLHVLGLQGPGRRQAGGQCCFGFLGEDETAQQARGVGQRRDDRVLPVEPDRAPRRVRHRVSLFRAGTAVVAVGPVVLRARTVAVETIVARAFRTRAVVARAVALESLAVRAIVSAAIGPVALLRARVVRALALRAVAIGSVALRTVAVRTAWPVLIDA